MKYHTTFPPYYAKSLSNSIVWHGSKSCLTMARRMSRDVGFVLVSRAFQSINAKEKKKEPWHKWPIKIKNPTKQWEGNSELEPVLCWASSPLCLGADPGCHSSQQWGGEGRRNLHLPSLHGVPRARARAGLCREGLEGFAAPRRSRGAAPAPLCGRLRVECGMRHTFRSQPPGQRIRWWGGWTISPN